MADTPAVSAADFLAGFGEPLSATLNVKSWSAGQDINADLTRLRETVRQASDTENALRAEVRHRILPRLADGQYAPPNAGHYSVPAEEVARAADCLLHSGHTEAVDSHCETIRTLPVTVHDICIALVSYQGGRNLRQQRLYRHDMRRRHENVVEDALALLARRATAGLDPDPLTRLAERSLLLFAERAALVELSEARWRIGTGSLAPYELMNGGGSPDLMIESVKVLCKLVEYGRFVFVAGQPDNRLWATLGAALEPLEYAIVSDLNLLIERFIENITWAAPVTADNRWDGVALTPEKWLRRFCDEVAPRVVVGVYRATLHGPARVFFARADHAHTAAHLAIADSVSQEMSGMPMLLELARLACRSATGSRPLVEAVTAGIPRAFHLDAP